MNFFKPEDFDFSGPGYCGIKASPGCQKAMADKANTKLECEGKVVTGFTLTEEHKLNAGELSFGTGHDARSTHKALLINIEPLEICVHPIFKRTKRVLVTREALTRMVSSIGSCPQISAPTSKDVMVEEICCECGEELK